MNSLAFNVCLFLIGCLLLNCLVTSSSIPNISCLIIPIFSTFYLFFFLFLFMQYRFKLFKNYIGIINDGIIDVLIHHVLFLSCSVTINLIIIYVIFSLFYEIDWNILLIIDLCMSFQPLITVSFQIAVCRGVDSLWTSIESIIHENSLCFNYEFAMLRDIVFRMIIVQLNMKLSWASVWVDEFTRSQRLVI